jgi:hypothetical protein
VRVADLDEEGRQPEFAAALQGLTGINIRTHSAFGVPVLYVAVPVSGGAVRLACPLADMEIESAHAFRTLAAASGTAVLVALLISALASAVVSRT